MWTEELPNGKYKYVERYKDHTGKWRKVSLTHMKKNNSVKKEMTKRLQDKIDKKLATNSIKKVTFKEVADEWLALHAKTVKFSSAKAYETHLNTICSTLGGVELSDLNAGMVNRFLLDELNRGLKYDTVRLKLHTIREVIGHAVKFGYIEEDKISHKLHLPKINKSVQNDFKYLEVDEIKKVLKQLDGHPVYQRMVMVLVNTGLRFGELVAIQESDIDFDNNSISISKTYNSFYDRLGTPKTGKERVIYFNNDLKSVLREQVIYTKELKLINQLDKSIEYVFLNARGKPVKLVTFNSILKTVDLPSKKKVTAHYFRHTYITLMVQEGVDRKLIARQVGHNSLEMIDKVYAHFTEQMERNQKEMQLTNKII